MTNLEQLRRAFAMELATASVTRDADRLLALTAVLGTALSLTLGHICCGKPEQANDVLETTFQRLSEAMNDSLSVARKMRSVGARQ